MARTTKELGHPRSSPLILSQSHPLLLNKSSYSIDIIRLGAHVSRLNTILKFCNTGNRTHDACLIVRHADYNEEIFQETKGTKFLITSEITQLHIWLIYLFLLNIINKRNSLEPFITIKNIFNGVHRRPNNV